MNPSTYQERRQQLLAKMDKLREVRDDLKHQILGLTILGWQ